ncbi:MAG: hypothetical protein UY41_C0001G0034 [Candidatus Moranbacteria bacterium GW2011_GWE1_49_15]|nr:MAG: hypothetical protein UX75_C0025G0011 [Candidatus Moranbacteria bacterium GW2011_GWE2_47_10]KKW07606.1 MAG: hypothetical protein UY41_C0001G0034 [Candidatus Moranbacteria bacterium GW2011_GWE1_49_15]HBP01060.1 hypothetical protein [Candidatus Moranbacteria bacterium]
MFPEENQSYFKVLNNRNSLLDGRKIDIKSRIFLYLSILLLVFAFVVIYLDIIDFLTPGMSIGNKDNWVTWLIFISGVAINFFCVPILYWSSFDKFKKNDEFWDRESFWILPLFFFGSFFQYISGLPYSLVILPFSLMLIFAVHIWVMMLSRDLIVSNEQFENSMRYFKSFTYLTAYYLIFTVCVVTFDLFDKFKYWME